jgi:hypothetical protein
MQTTKLISTISYNTPSFLKGKLFTLVNQGIIEYAHWIWHKPETDETKEHAHLVLKPNRRLDTMALGKEFLELVPGEDKPRVVLPFKSSKMKDWILYAVHDKCYLLRKNQNRAITYQKTDLHTTEYDLLEEDWRDAHEGEDGRIKQVIEAARSGVSFRQLVEMGVIPINQLFQLREVYQDFFVDALERGGRDGHEETAQ